MLTSNALKAEEGAAWPLVTWEKKAGPPVPFLPICGLNGMQLENIHVPTLMKAHAARYRIRINTGVNCQNEKKGAMT